MARMCQYLCQVAYSLKQVDAMHHPESEAVITGYYLVNVECS
ncbi:hypothetical protein [Shewanella sp. Scap07]|nr:hypothetical protein [Shewanella sp. Scap07]